MVAVPVDPWAWGFLVVVIGMFLGAAMVVAPRTLWWLTQSWKFEKPAAEEPGGTGYALARLGGVVLMATAVGIGGTVVFQDRQRADEPSA